MTKFGIIFNYKNDFRRGCVYLIAPTIVIFSVLAYSNHIFDIYANKSYLHILCINGLIIQSLIWIPIVISFSTFLHGVDKRFVALNSLLRFFHHNSFEVI